METYTPKVAIRKPAPLFETISYYKKAFRKIKLADYRGKYVLLFFYPLDFTFVCPTEIIAFSDRAEEFRKLGCEVIACSTDSQFSHREYCLKSRDQGGLGNMEIPILADVTKQVSKDYGVLIEEGGDAGVALRGTFLIDREGIVRHISVNDLPVGRNVDEYFRLLQAFLYVEEHGEVCPAKWEPGKPTMKDDHESEKTQDYWKNIHGKKE